MKMLAENPDYLSHIFKDHSTILTFHLYFFEDNRFQVLLNSSYYVKSDSKRIFQNPHMSTSSVCKVETIAYNM